MCCPTVVRSHRASMTTVDEDEPLEDGADMPGRESSLSGLGAYNDERAAQADARFATADVGAFCTATVIWRTAGIRSNTDALAIMLCKHPWSRTHEPATRCAVRAKCLN